MNKKSRFTIENLPIRKKDAIKKKIKKKLGLISRARTIQPVSFRLRPEINALLKTLTQNLVMESPIKLSNTDAIELLILFASKQDTRDILRVYEKIL
jgi:hypothetical protein